MYQLLRITLLSSIVMVAGCNGGTSDSAPVSTPGTSPAPGGDVGVAIELDANTGLPSTRPVLGMAAGGDAIAVWQIRDGTGRLRVVSRRYTNQGWDNLEFLDVVTTANQNAATPHIAMNTSGQAVVAWVQSDSTFNSTSGIISDVGSVWIRTFTPAVGWSAPEALTPPTSTLPLTNSLLIPDFPSVAINESGTALVLWSRARDTSFVNNGHTVISARRRPAGQTTWEAQTELDATATEKREPQVIVDNAGNAQTFWKRYTSRSPATFSVFDLIVSRLAAPSSTWQAPQTLASVNEDVVSEVSAAMIGTDQALVSWSHYRPVTDDEVTQARSYQNGGWQPVDDLDVGYFPRLAADGTGAVLANATPFPTNGNLLAAARLYRPASGWSVPPRFLDDPLMLSGSPVVAANTLGQAMTAWPRVNGVSFVPERLYANYFDGSNWQAIARALAGSATGDIPVDIKLDANGNAIVLWLRGVGSGAALWANRFAIP